MNLTDNHPNLIKDIIKKDNTTNNLVNKTSRDGRKLKSVTTTTTTTKIKKKKKNKVIIVVY